MKVRKSLSLLLATVLSISMLAGCGAKTDSKEVATEGAVTEEATSEEATSEEVVAEDVTLVVGNWPDDTKPESVEQHEKLKEEFETANPNVTITPNTYYYEVKTFTAKAAAGQLPNLLQNLPFTDVKSVAKNGFAADITEAAEASGLLEKIDPAVIELCSGEDGKLYTLPRVVYVMGLMMNKALFEQAGLVNEDGTVMIPQTYEELAEYAVQIKEKTGVSGFALPTTGNHGGWILMNIAWNYGVTFEEQDENGNYVACFNSQEFHDALQYVYDLKWKHDVLQDNMAINAVDALNLLATDQTAMIIGHSDWCNHLASTGGMATTNLAMGKIPEGPGGRYAQLGGSLFMLSADSTDAQIKTAFDWIKHIGYGPVLNEETYRENCELSASEGKFVFPKVLVSPWTDEERIAKMEEIAAPYANVDMKDFKEYNTEGIELRAEPAACAQELYSILDGVIQEVLTNENVDIEAISAKAQEDFQLNHLDKMD